ncbi:hypothetical protein [Chryseobacterium camelliae]|uniref:hypothetical protein n=1 Tax=Chryseobacterium camelliae TaxID=1265445 RepID=UPI0028678432|nr:hypothetical protein [Chryseobacterium camelliae]MDR6515853.1 hypothetical protein [Chryseobacterium camelliae]
MTDSYLPYVQGREIEWLELNLLKSNMPLSKSTVMSLANDVDENDVDSWFSELIDRGYDLELCIYEQRGNTIYPLYRWDSIPEYFLCLYFCYFGASKDKIGTKLFERISSIALKNYIGGEIKTFGFPSDTNLNRFLDEVAPLCFEQRGILAHPDYKDDGVDVLCYKNFGDSRSGNMYVLLQCAAGINWTSKSPINLTRWVRYIYWPQSNLLTSIATTEYIQKSSWVKRVDDYGLLLDRCRVTNWYSKMIDNDLRNEVIDWCNDKKI